MSHKPTGQKSIADSFIRNRDGLNDRLSRIDALIDWKPFAKSLGKVYSSDRGRPSNPPLTLFKALLLAQWYNLSDYELEAAIDDRLSFRRFIGLGLDETAPDHSVYSRFRSRMISQGLERGLFDELSRQMDKLGLLIKSGTMVDATIVGAAVSKPPKNDDGTAGKSETDPDAGWTCKGKKRDYFGYKAHIGADEGSGIVRKYTMTVAGVYDGKILEPLLSGDEEWAFGDKAYGYAENSGLLERLGIGDGLMRRHYGSDRNAEAVNKLRNRVISSRRAGVERVFGTLKRSYGYLRVRYLGLAKNGLELMLRLFAYNLRKAESLA